MKSQSKTVFYTVRNGEEQGDTNRVDDFNREVCVVCEVGVTNTNVYLCVCMVLQFSLKLTVGSYLLENKERVRTNCNHADKHRYT